jgi:hypothetical protein
MQMLLHENYRTLGLTYCGLGGYYFLYLYMNKSIKISTFAYVSHMCLWGFNSNTELQQYDTHKMKLQLDLHKHKIKV